MKNHQAISYRTATVGNINIFYREAGDPKAPTVVLLHGYPTSSHMFRNLIPILAKQFHVVAPDLPGFGFSDAPNPDSYDYTFGSPYATQVASLRSLHRTATPTWKA